MARVQPILHERVHDYGHLIRRWRSVARTRGLKLEPYTSASGYQLFCARSRRPRPMRPWIYLSAGIHGDEPASTEACLEWMTISRFTDFNALVFPCLNPWGLVNNLRTDAEGRDLNRTYHDNAVAQTSAHKALLANQSFDLALALHEDYDANGVYIYEVPSIRPYWAEEMLAAASRYLPVDTRRTIEGRSSRAGIVRRAIRIDTMPHHPEAFVLHFHHSHRTFTVETPSEAHIDARVAAQVAIVDRAVRLCLANFADKRRLHSVHAS